jgi:hypothetical protein
MLGRHRAWDCVADEDPDRDCAAEDVPVGEGDPLADGLGVGLLLTLDVAVGEAVRELVPVLVLVLVAFVARTPVEHTATSIRIKRVRDMAHRKL